MPERAAHALRGVLEEEILGGRLAPGTRLDESGLARRFAVSRTPVREALLALEGSGLVELRPRRGAFVRRLGARELFEMFELMGELEAACGRFACRRMTGRQEERLDRQLALCAEAARRDDLDVYYAENELFHQTIYLAAGNSVLQEQALALQARLRPFRSRQLRVRGRMGQSLAEHEEIVAAIRDGDEPRAEAALRLHISAQGEKFTVLMAALEGADASADAASAQPASRAREAAGAEGGAAVDPAESA